jgi:hypothetical protein
MQDFIKLVLRPACLLAARTAIDSPNNIVSLAFAHLVPLAVAAAMIIVAIPIVVIVSAWEAAAFLFFLVHPELHHVR